MCGILIDAVTQSELVTVGKSWVSIGPAPPRNWAMSTTLVAFRYRKVATPLVQGVGEQPVDDQVVSWALVSDPGVV